MAFPQMRLTIGRLMAAVAVIGLDLSLLQTIYYIDVNINSGTTQKFGCALILIPPISLLAVGAVAACSGLARRGRASPFSTGYLLIGGLASLVASLLACLDFASDSEVIFGVMDSAPPWFAEMFLVAISTVPQIIFGTIGGVLASRYGLSIALGDRTIRD